MKENDVQEVARHMGHELAVHRKFYRLQDDVIELAKISKLLLAVESGQAHHFKGMSLDDLDLKDFPDEETDPVDLLSFTTEENTIPETLVGKPANTCKNQPLPALSDDFPLDPALTESESESDLEWDTRIKKKIRRTGEKKKWTLKEKELLKPMIYRAVRLGKPPTKQDVQSLQKKNPVLAPLPWLKIKHQAWALAQAELRKDKKS
ncbi:uncharacterized protein LOC132740736 isoform X2 [Ruditapes philippinarum]|uniref:uncharacterized protein LOC132740736 isoform X2 n=1 Tax=Ruditapes philippinarum TaxID=129788 RepID=UPI00295B93FB|nr:uncharacterized protein LOC132740736 isoform X2 [Ruditapes philippinarum]